jgi:hypothetical protein
MQRTTLYVAVSFHGYGHIAQTAPVVNALCARRTDLRVVVESAAPQAVLTNHFHVPFEHLQCGTDFGMVMRDSLNVDVAASHARYVAQVARWEAQIEAAADRLRPYHPALVFGNVPYLPLLAAHRYGCPAIAMCSLNWAEIYLPYCAGYPGAADVHARLLDGYRAAQTFILPAPSMPMPALANTVGVGPIARIGRREPSHLRASLGVGTGTRIVAIFMGGVPTPLPLARWPRVAGMHWLVGGSDCPERPDMTPLDRLRMPYIDVVSSCDALITKPGYGGFAEAACNAIPVLYVERQGWPEAPYLVAWLTQQARCLALDRSVLAAGEVMSRLEELWALPARPALLPQGTGEAADLLAAALGEPYGGAN